MYSCTSRKYSEQKTFPCISFLSTYHWETANFAGGFIPGAMPSKKPPSEIKENKGDSAGKYVAKHLYSITYVVHQIFRIHHDYLFI